MTVDKLGTILRLLEEGDKQLKFGSSRNVILVLGEALADKLVLTRFVAGQDQNLVSRGLRFGKDWVFQIEQGFTRSVESVGVVPQLIVDSQADGAVLYDCPEFNYENPEAPDIASAFFTQKVISKVDSVKLVFVVKYDSVMQGANGNLEAVGKFLSHAAQFVRDVDKFKESIGLVVTQVAYGISESEIHNLLANVLQHARSQGKHVESNWLNTLLQLHGKIGIWRRPVATGHVRNMQSVQDDRKSLRKLIYEKLHFTVRDTKDFGLVLSDSSKRYMPALVDAIREKIITYAANVGEQFIGAYRELEKQSRDAHDLFLMFYNTENDDPSLRKIMFEDWQGITDARGFVMRILEITDGAKISISKEALLKLLNSDLHLKFAETALGRSSGRVNWADGFKKFIRYVKHSSRWYQNLDNLQNVVLTSYHNQQNLEKARSAAQRLKTTIARGGDFIESFRRFLLAINQHEGIIEDVLQLDIDENKRELLGEIVDITFQNNLTTICDPALRKLTISGQFVKISDIIKCDGIKCCENPKEIELFAAHKVFFDADYDWTGKEVQLSIIAPTWEVIGNRKITLDGVDGEKHRVAKEGAQATRPGSPGKPGLSGHPGGPAGGLLAVGKECVSCNQLTISLVGGNGGPGQDGGDGRNGEDGKRPYNPCDDESWTSMKELWTANGNKPYCKLEQRLIGYICSAYGLEGKVGGKGGDGGKGGFGGPSGIAIVSFGHNGGSPNVKIGNGSPGANGKGGKGGVNGKKGDDLNVTVYYRSEIFYLSGHCNAIYKPHIAVTSSSPNGGDGLNNAGLKSTQPLLFIKPSFPLNFYKAFMRSNLNRSLKKSHNFLQHLEQDKGITGLYDTVGLVKDMQVLEKQFNTLQNEIPLLPHYTYLLRRIEGYSENLSNTMENDDDHKMVFSYLYSSVLTKIRNINNKLNEGLVVNIKGHLGSVRSDIEKLKESREAVNKNKSKSVYQQGIKNKIEEANKFINDIIEPEVRNIIGKTDQQINALIDETLALEAAALKERDELIKRKQALQDQMILRYLLGAVDIASKLLVLAGPVGATVGAVVGGVSQVAGGLLLTDDDGNHNLAAIPEGVQKSFTAISDHIKKKKESFNKQLADAKESMDKFDADALRDSSIQAVRQKIQETQNKLKLEMGKESEFDPESIDRMYNMRKELSESLDKEKALLEKAAGKADKKVDYLGKVKDLIEVGKAGKEVYDKIMKSQGAIDKLGDTIKKANNNIAYLELQEQNIYKTIMPMCQGISDTLQKLRNESAGKSHVALDVSKWQVQSNIRDISKKLKEMTQGYKSQGELTYLMGKVEHGMSTMIQVYDRIQDYQEKAELADYLAQISITSGKVGTIKDEVLRDAVDYLEMNLHFNLVISEYEKSIDALKHSVFPFAKRYLNSPENALSKYQFKKSDSLIENMVDVMKSEFDGYIQELGKDENMVSNADAFIRPNQPYMTSLGSYPFFSWKFIGNEDIIEKLLDGREIVLIADVASEQVENLVQNAIKFSHIGIDLLLSDSSAQSKMRAQLEGFKVNMTHLGNSHYVCGSKSFDIVHNPETIQHSVNKRVDWDKREADYYSGSENNAYLKLKNSYPLLSPYTTWKINLFRDTSRRGDYSFGKLAEFKGQPIELELEGRGLHIQRDYQANERVCNDELDKFYQETKTSDKEDHVDVQLEVDLREILADGGATNVKRNLRAAAAAAASNGGAASSKTASISGVLTSISDAAVKYLNPVQWFSNDSSSHQSSEQLIGSSFVIPGAAVPTNSSKLIFYSNENSMSNEYKGSLDIQSNLLLMGLLGPKRNSSGNNRRRSARKTDDDFAHDIAYRAYSSNKLN